MPPHMAGDGGLSRSRKCPQRLPALIYLSVPPSGGAQAGRAARDIAEELLKNGRDPLTMLPPGLAGNFEPLLDQPPSPYLMLRTPYAS